MRKSILAIFLLIGLSFGQIVIQLDQKNLTNLNAIQDIVYTKNVLFDSESEQQPAIFDTTQDTNWRSQPYSASYAVPSPVPSPLTFSVYDRRLPIQNWVNNSTAEVTIDSNKYKKSSTNKGEVQNPAANPYLHYFTPAQQVWQTKVTNGLAIDEQGAFLKSALAAFKFGKKGFSFHINNCSNALILGEPNGYYASEAVPIRCTVAPIYQSLLVTPRVAYNNYWGLNLVSLSVSSSNSENSGSAVYTFAQKTSATATQPNQQVVFDSSTYYMWVDQPLLTYVVSALSNNYGVSCAGSGDNCPCNPRDAPKITFNFAGCFSEKSSVTVSYLDLITKKDDNTCSLILKVAPAQQTTDAGDTNAVALDDQYYRFGYGWFSAVYTYFDQTNTTISMSPAYKTKCQPKTLDETSRYAALIGSGFLIFLAVAIILGSLGKVPYYPEQQPVFPENVYVQQPGYQFPMQLSQVGQSLSPNRFGYR